MALQLTCLRTGVVTQMALVRLFTSVTSPMYHQVALEFEDLTAELTRLDLALCMWRGGVILGHL